jgi:single-strand DNA-binding protein
LNNVTLVGNLGQDPEVRYTQSQKAVSSFSVATSEGKDKTEWHRIVCWEQTAENCAKYLKKGSKVAIQGSIHTRTWQDKDGRKCYTTEITAHRVEFLSSPGGAGGDAAGQEGHGKGQADNAQQAGSGGGWQPPENRGDINISDNPGLDSIPF